MTRKELLAVVYFTKYYKHFLYGNEFKIRTDYSSLKWLLNCKNPEGQLARWFESNFQMTIEHRAGSKHRNADALSRIPCRKLCCLEAKSNVYSMACQSSESSTSLKAKQSEDKDIKQVLKWVASGVKPNSEELSSNSQFVKALYSQWDDLKVCTRAKLVQMVKFHCELFYRTVRGGQCLVTTMTNALPPT